MEFMYCFGYFTDKELTELQKALLTAFESSACDKVCSKANTCKECEYTHACGFLNDAIIHIADEKERRRCLHD